MLPGGHHPQEWNYQNQGNNNEIAQTIPEYLKFRKKAGSWCLNTDLVMIAKILQLNFIVISLRGCRKENIDVCQFGGKEKPYFIIKYSEHHFTTGFFKTCSRTNPLAVKWTLQ